MGQAVLPHVGAISERIAPARWIWKWLVDTRVPNHNDGVVLLGVVVDLPRGSSTVVLREHVICHLMAIRLRALIGAAMVVPDVVLLIHFRRSKLQTLEEPRWLVAALMLHTGAHVSHPIGKLNLFNWTHELKVNEVWLIIFTGSESRMSISVFYFCHIKKGPTCGPSLIILDRITTSLLLLLN